MQAQPFASPRPTQLLLMQQAIDDEPNPFRADCLRAEHASIMARHGYKAEARAIVAELRARYGARPHPSVSIWINIADAIVERTALPPSDAIAKLRRARALAEASGDEALQALAAAWLSHVLWNAQEVDAAAAHAREALRLAEADDHRARSRVCLVVAEMLALSGCEESAGRWFAAARRHAAADGDDAAKSALNFNLCSIQVMLLRRSHARSKDGATPRRAELHRGVSDNVDALLGVFPGELELIQRAQICSLLDRPHEALAAYRELQASPEGAAQAARALSLADAAWCCVRIGDVVEARRLAACAEAAPRAGLHIDDEACLRSLLARVYRGVGDREREASSALAADDAWRRCAEHQLRCARLCETITEAG